MVKPKNNMMNGKRGSKRRLHLPRATKIDLSQFSLKKILHLNVNKVNSRRNMFFS